MGIDINKIEIGNYHFWKFKFLSILMLGQGRGEGLHLDYLLPIQYAQLIK